MISKELKVTRCFYEWNELVCNGAFSSLSIKKVQIHSRHVYSCSLATVSQWDYELLGKIIKAIYIQSSLTHYFAAESNEKPNTDKAPLAKPEPDNVSEGEPIKSIDEPEPEPIKTPDEPEGKPANEYETVVSHGNFLFQTE